MIGNANSVQPNAPQRESCSLKSLLRDFPEQLVGRVGGGEVQSRGRDTSRTSLAFVVLTMEAKGKEVDSVDVQVLTLI